MKKSPLRKRSKSPTSKLQRECDKHLTPIIKLMYPNCLLCGDKTEVAHHHIHRSKSLLLRYDIDNLIPLCNRCHMALHHNESYYASKIVEIRGISWFKELDRKKHQTIKADVLWYEKQRDNLEDIKFKLIN